MANRRELKKDINWLTEEVVSDCLIYWEFNKNKNKEHVVDIINSVITKRNELISRINKPSSKMTRHEVKSAYSQVVKEMFEVTNESLEKLSELAKKNAKAN